MASTRILKEYNPRTNSWEGYAFESDALIDEKVKMNSTSTSSYLIDLVDGTTLQNKNGKLTVKSIDGVTVTNNELNMLQGTTSNLQAQLNALTRVGNFTTSVTNYTDLVTILSPTINDMVIVTNDENNDDSSTIYIHNGSDWVYTGKFKSGEIRDFTIDSLDLITETVGILPKNRYEKPLASEIMITDVNGNTNVEDVITSTNERVDDLEQQVVNLDLGTIPSDINTNRNNISNLQGRVNTIEDALGGITSGEDGLSAYEIALGNGFVGSESDWLISLKGTDGINGVDGSNGNDGINGVDGVYEGSNPPVDTTIFWKKTK